MKNVVIKIPYCNCTGTLKKTPIQMKIKRIQELDEQLKSEEQGYRIRGGINGS